MLSFFLASNLSAASEDIKVFYWANTIPRSVFEDFEKETGIHIIATIFDSDELLEAKLYAGLTGFDVIILTANPFLPNHLKAQFYQKLDKSKLNNYKHLDPAILRKLDFYDPGNAYAIPFSWGTAGIGMDAKKILEIMPNAPVQSWKIFFEPDILKNFQKCGVSMVDSPTEVIPLMLGYLGYNPHSLKLNELDHAMQRLRLIRPYIKEINNSNYISNFANGDLCLALGWSGNIIQARDAARNAKKGIDIEYKFANELTPMWIDIIAIHHEAPNADGAHKFLNFMMKPEISARITNETGFANGNLSSRAFISPHLLNDTVLFPSAEKIEHFHMDKPAPLRYEQKRVRAWEQFKSSQ
jgi:putrescine transport system substrate-binding protein